MQVFSRHVRTQSIFSMPFALAAVTMLSPVSSNAVAAVIDFDSLQTGEVVTDQFLPSDGLRIKTVNFWRWFDLGIIYDSTGTDPGADNDLEGPPWARGNLAPMNTVLNNILIIAENDTDADMDGLIDVPDDEGHRPAGEFILSFDTPITQFGLDLVDIECENECKHGRLRFYDSGVKGTWLGTVGFGDFTKAGSMFYDPTVTYGDNSANRIAPILASDFGAVSFDTVVIRMGGSGGIDTLVYEPIPEPATIVLLAASAGAMVLRRRRRS